MICIVTALFSEAEALIEYFKLKKSENKIFSVYTNDNICLVVSGIGKINAAVATTYILKNHKFDKIFNIGICGTNNKDNKIGFLYLIKTIIDKETDKKFILQKNGEVLYCVSKPISKLDISKKVLVDMESAGFYQAAVKFAQKDNINILKIVSDFLDTSIPSKKSVYNLIKQNIKNIEIKMEMI